MISLAMRMLIALRPVLAVSSARWIGGRMRDGSRVSGGGRTRNGRMSHGSRQAQSQQKIDKLHICKNGRRKNRANETQSKSMSEISVQPKKMRERLNRGKVGWLQFVRYGYTFFLEVIYQKSLARLSRACFSTARFGARAREGMSRCHAGTASRNASGYHLQTLRLWTQ